MTITQLTSVPLGADHRPLRAHDSVHLVIRPPSLLGLWLQSLNGVALARTLNTKVGKSSCGTLPWEASRRKLCSRLGRTAPDQRLARCFVEPNGPDHPFPGPMSARETAPKRARGVLSNTNHFVNQYSNSKFIPSMILIYCVFL